jgi:glycerol-3-phosphate O-acyltransferase
VTPGALTALVLLSDERRSIPHEQLLFQAQCLLRVLIALQARITPRTATDGVLNAEAIRDAAQMFVDAELLETHQPGEFSESEQRAVRPGPGSMYRVPERKRIEVDVSKNLIVHFFAERALLSIALLMPPGTDISLELARDRLAKLAELFKYEFRYRSDKDYAALFNETLNAMVSVGEAELFPEGRVDVGSGHDGQSGGFWLRAYASIVRNFVEGYRVAARGLVALLRGPLTEKDLLKRTLTVGHRMYLAGEIERHEAICKPILLNALLAFKDEGYVQQREGKYQLTSSFAGADAVSTIEARIAGYLELTAV